MANWTAKVWMGSDAGYSDVTVNAATSVGAKEVIQRMYGTSQIMNLYQVSNTPTGSLVSGIKLMPLVYFFGFGYLFATFTALAVSIIFGGVGTWLTELCLGKSLNESLNKNDNNAVTWILTIAIILGGIGFGHGTAIHKEYFSSPQKTVKSTT